MASKEKIIDFAKALYDELDKNNWGDIDPYFLKYIAMQDFDVEDEENIRDLEACIKKALEKIGV